MAETILSQTVDVKLIASERARQMAPEPGRGELPDRREDRAPRRAEGGPIVRTKALLLCLLLLSLLFEGCEKTYHCIGYQDRLVENRPGEPGPPLCETPEGEFYQAQEARQ